LIFDKKLSIIDAMKLLKVLGVFCVVGEVGTALGVLIGLAGIPFIRSGLSDQSGVAGVFVEQGQIEFSFRRSLPRGGSVSSRVERLEGVEAPAGSLILGPMQVGTSALKLVDDRFESPGASLAATGARVILQRPEHALAAFGRLAVPIAVSLFTRAAIWIGLLEMLRRLFRAVARGEAFAPSTLRLVYWIGGLLITSSVMSWLTAKWATVLMALSVERWIPPGNQLVEVGSEAGISALTAGIIVLALAEVFRQGCRLSEEARLTV
jgi:hypothetical protein